MHTYDNFWRTLFGVVNSEKMSVLYRLFVLVSIWPYCRFIFLPQDIYTYCFSPTMMVRWKMALFGWRGSFFTEPWLGGGFKYVISFPYLGRFSPIWLAHIFSNGLVQLPLTLWYFLTGRNRNRTRMKDVFPIKHENIPASYVSLPEGNRKTLTFHEILVA